MKTHRNPRFEAQPFLLDRLTNHRSDIAPGLDVRHAPSNTQLRNAILRDLGWLLNSTNLEATDNLDAYSHVRRSVVNFGARAFAGARLREINPTAVGSAIREAIVLFEPRIQAESLEVRCVPASSSVSRHNALSLEISGQLSANQPPEAFHWHLELDLESGRFTLRSHRIG